MLVVFPGNETAIDTESGYDSNHAIGLGFDGAGALTQVVAQTEDVRLRKLSDVTSLIDTSTQAAKAGADLRGALAPPSLTERAAEAKAAAELGLTASSVDPLADLKARVEEQQLRAQLNLAEQIQRATFPPSFVTVMSSSTKG